MTFEKRSQLHYFLLCLGIIFIILWQSAFAIHKDHLDSRYRNQASVGAYWYRYFTVFHQTGLFPIAIMDGKNAPLNANEIWDFIKAHPKTINLFSDIEQIPVFFYYPDAFLRKTPYGARPNLANGAAFTLSLILLYFAFWYARLEMLGLITVILLGSNPFQLFEIYNNHNIFGWPIIINLTLLALYLPILTKSKTPGFYPWLTAVLG